MLYLHFRLSDIQIQAMYFLENQMIAQDFVLKYVTFIDVHPLTKDYQKP